MFDPIIFREYDIRGVFNEQFDIDFAERLGHAFGHYVRQKTGKTNGQKLRLSLGMDARLSSPSISNAVAQGFMQAGAEVIRLGLVTSPITYFSTFKLPDIDGAIMVTGSHNPPEYNGFKVSLGQSTIFGEEIQNLRRVFLFL
jgi:phosphomannomutase/phosphomannomutase/phosphoglucomutase